MHSVQKHPYQRAARASTESASQSGSGLFSSKGRATELSCSRFGLQTGPHITWGQLTGFQSCREGREAYSCAIFADRTPRTIAMTVRSCQTCGFLRSSPEAAECRFDDKFAL